MRVVILVEPPAMDAGEPDESEGNCHSTGDDQRALQDRRPRGEVGPGVGARDAVERGGLAGFVE